TADKNPQWLQTGEMLQVGMTWKLAEGPWVGAEGGGGGGGDLATQKLMETLAELDKIQPTGLPTPAPNAPIEEYNLKRAEIIEKIIERVPPAEREVWIKQLADNLSTAALHAQAG